MRDLLFNIEQQRIERAGNFRGLVKGTRGFLRARFTFGTGWSGCKKAASFHVGKSEKAVLIEDGVCMVPPEACDAEMFEVSVTGMKPGYKVKTGRVKVYQEG